MMLLRDYIKELQSFVEHYPEAEVIYAKDEEGNGFQHVVYEPTVGYFDGNDFDSTNKDVNAICIN